MTWGIKSDACKHKGAYCKQSTYDNDKLISYREWRVCKVDGGPCNSDSCPLRVNEEPKS